MNTLPGEYNFDLYEGDTCSFSVTYSEGAEGEEVPVDLTGCTFSAQFRQKKADAAATASMVVTMDPDQTTNTGKMSLFLNAANSELLVSKRYFWDLEVTWPSGKVQTILAGVVSVIKDVSR